jgi:blue copper oxidase
MTSLLRPRLAQIGAIGHAAAGFPACWTLGMVSDGVRLLVSFDQLATRERPFMFYCHILEHEDAGMMGQYATV